MYMYLILMKNLIQRTILEEKYRRPSGLRSEQTTGYSIDMKSLNH